MRTRQRAEGDAQEEWVAGQSPLQRAGDRPQVTVPGRTDGRTGERFHAITPLPQSSPPGARVSATFPTQGPPRTPVPSSGRAGPWTGRHPSASRFTPGHTTSLPLTLLQPPDPMGTCTYRGNLVQTAPGQREVTRVWVMGRGGSRGRGGWRGGGTAGGTSRWHGEAGCSSGTGTRAAVCVEAPEVWAEGLSRQLLPQQGWWGMVGTVR